MKRWSFIFILILACNKDDPVTSNFSFIPEEYCFQGTWIHERCTREADGADTLRINPMNQVFQITADCSGQCLGDQPFIVQRFTIVEIWQARISIQNIASVRCGEQVEEDSNPFEISYECKGDTLDWGGMSFLRN